MKELDYAQSNAQTWDTWNEKGIEWSIPVTHEDYVNAQSGTWTVCLTTTKPVPREWFRPFAQCRILGLASAGGQQMPIFRALGADITVMDYSDKQLDCEKRVAEREGYQIDIVKADMSKPFPFSDDQFDMIFHPVSNVYVEEVQPVWSECSRVLKKGGLLLSGMANPVIFMFGNDDSLRVVNKLPYNPLKTLSKEEIEKRVHSKAGFLFGHTLTDLIGAQLQAGFAITHFYEDYNLENWHPIGNYTPTYFATRAIKL